MFYSATVFPESTAATDDGKTTHGFWHITVLDTSHDIRHDHHPSIVLLDRFVDIVVNEIQLSLYTTNCLLSLNIFSLNTNDNLKSTHGCKTSDENNLISFANGQIECAN